MSVINTLALYAKRLIDELSNQEIATYPLMQSAKLNYDDLNHKEHQIPQNKYINLVRQVIEKYNITTLGFQVGQHTGMLEHGIISYAILSCENLRESIRRFEKYQHLIGPVLTIKLTTIGDTAVLSAIPAPHVKWLPSSVIKYFTQEWIASFMQWEKFIHCPDGWFSHINFGFSETDEQSSYQSFINCSFEFDHSVTQVFFPKEYLELPLNFADHETNELCINQCEKLLKNIDVASEQTSDIQRLLASNPSRTPSIKEVSSILCITPRTLHRRLLKENTSYQQIVIQFRISLAKRYLKETNLPICEVAMLVGYADHSNFYRTFRKETGITPLQFRQEIESLAA